MKRILVGGLFAVLCACSAQAFEQSTTKGAAPSVPAKPSMELGTETLAPPSGVGTTVRIPGLGALGVLPKLDFGLELLYGEGRTVAVEPRDDDPAVDNEGLRIKGTLKHRF